MTRQLPAIAIGTGPEPRHIPTTSKAREEARFRVKTMLRTTPQLLEPALEPTRWARFYPLQSCAVAATVGALAGAAVVELVTDSPRRHSPPSEPRFPRVRDARRSSASGWLLDFIGRSARTALLSAVTAKAVDRAPQDAPASPLQPADHAHEVGE
ncbi:MAG: hypothetical protein KDD69_15080 [Bdellovibrionales bacterium]|nr:hypothetical protein [Bdellovibrionales bacterium]